MITLVDDALTDSGSGTSSGTSTACGSTVAPVIFPNPSTGSFVLTGAAGHACVIFDATGKLAAEGRTTAPHTAIDLNNVKEGVHFLRLLDQPTQLLRIVVTR